MWIILFLFAILVGAVVGCPIGAAGALVSDAALAHQKRRLRLTILATASGDTIVAFSSTLAAKTIKLYVDKYYMHFSIVAGILVIGLAVFMWIATSRSKHAVSHAEDLDASSKWILGHTAPAIAAFIITVFHPGSILAFLGLVAIISKQVNLSLLLNRMAFTVGVAAGSASICSISAFLFWKIREKADKFVHYLRYGLAVIVAFLGIYLILSILWK